ncbi:MAG: HAD family hydrolase [Thermomicrobia bacterium]|nr:HAD family hydrolase [Thermomicrobia bacterium]
MARPRAVTFDFHDTIAIAPAWFALEVRQLPGMVLHTLAAQGVIPHDGAQMAAATAPYRALRLAIQEHGQESDALAGVQHAFRSIGITLPDVTVAAAIEELMVSVQADAAPRPGIVETVAGLAAAGIPMAVISNAVYHPFIEWCLDDWGLHDAFAAVISSASCGYYKSHDGIYTCALAALGVAPGETVHIGDSYRFDVEAAHRLGLRTVWLNLTGNQRDPCVADLVVTDLHGLAPRVLDLA